MYKERGMRYEDGEIMYEDWGIACKGCGCPPTTSNPPLLPPPVNPPKELWASAGVHNSDQHKA